MAKGGAAAPDKAAGAGRRTSERLARGLGWLSLGVGAPLAAVPGAVCRLIGLDDTATTRGLLRTAGVRELGQGSGLLRGRRPAAWMWGRVVGDALDLAMLGRAFFGGRGERRLRAAIALVAGLTAVDLLTAVGVTRLARSRRRAIRVAASITVNRSTADVYRYWRNFENLPRFMDHLVSVQVTGTGLTRWVAKAPAGQRVEWEAEVVTDRPDRLIAWRSLPRARIPNAGSVRFTPAPGSRGTEVRVELVYRPPAGSLGKAVAKLFGEEPDQQVRDSLRRFKQVMETGEIVRSEGSPAGTGARRQVLQRPAQPLATTVVG